MMNMSKTIGIIALAVMLTTACSSKKAAAPAETDGKKPSLDFTVEVSGHTATINIKTTDIVISPQHYGKERVPGEGHMHVFLDDGPKQGVTDDKYVLPDLAVGSHTVKVSLHNNDHSPYNVSLSKEFEVK
jgi:type 1 fimbria pilin